jgi:hypothetical protein
MVDLIKMFYVHPEATTVGVLLDLHPYNLLLNGKKKLLYYRLKPRDLLCIPLIFTYSLCLL